MVLLPGAHGLAESGVFTIELSTTDTPDVARTLALEQNHPNPFNPQTVIVFSLPRAQDMSLRIYDVQGRLVRTLVQGAQAAVLDVAAGPLGRSLEQPPRPSAAASAAAPIAPRRDAIPGRITGPPTWRSGWP